MTGNPLTRGLINDDNSCYANSLLQMLARIPEMKKWTREYRHVGKGDPNDCIKCILRETLLDMWKPPWTISFIPKKLLKWIRGKDRRFAKGIQADPHELLGFLMEQIQLDIFQHGELEKVSCNIAEHETEEAIEVIPPGPGIQCYIGTSKNEDLTDRDLLRSYNFSITSDRCSLCPGRKCLERIIASPPTVLLLKINRFSKERNGWIKNESPCAIAHELELSLNDNDNVKYKMTGVIEHEGDTPTSGHYVSTVIDNQQWFSYSDAVVMRKEISKEETYMIFYSKLESEDQLLLDQYEQDVFDEEDVISLQNEVLYENPEIDGWREIYSRRIHSEWQTKCRLLVFCLPKSSEVSSFKDHFDKCLSSHQKMLYTVTWSNSNFLWRLRTDPVIQSEYDVYCEKIAPMFGANNVHGWLAEAFVIYILHNHMHRKNPSMEYICDLHSQSLVTRTIVKNWKKIKPNVLQSLRNLLHGKSLFCLDSCTESCNVEKDHYHQSLACMSKMLPSEDTAEVSLINSWTLNKTAEELIDHPLEEFLKPTCLKEDEDLKPQVLKFLEEIKISPEEPHNVYILMVVNSPKPHKAEDLFILWTDSTADFGLYVGMTKKGRYRKGHLIPEEQGGISSVSKFLNETSVVYLVTSKEYKNYNEAALGEAKLIAVFREKLEESRKTGIKLKYTILNKSLPVVPLHEADEKDKEEFDSFIASGQLPFRFINEPYQEESYKSETILNRFIVRDIIKSRQTCSINTVAAEEGFKCGWCVKVFRNEGMLSRHVEYHKAKKNHTCVVCNMLFISKYALKLHMQAGNCKVAYLCDTCEEVFNDKRSLSTHKNNVHADRNYVCEICNRGFGDSKSLINHKRCHKTGVTFLCEICKREFSDSVLLKCHTKMHETKTEYMCEICSKKFIDHSALISHKSFHTEDDYCCVCEVCKKRFVDNGLLQSHMKTHNFDKKYVCPVCNTVLKSKALLKKHVHVHMNEKAFICYICESRFTNNRALWRHMITHNSELYHFCPFCNKGFKRKDTMHEHLKVHTREKSFTCQSCQKPFAHKSALRKHMTMHSSERNHICPLCNIGFKRQDNLKRHINSHTGGRPFSCRFCENKYSRKSGLNKHIKLHHSKNKQFICQFCNESFKEQDSLKEHWNVHKNYDSFICKVCKKVFSNDYRLKRHMNSHNPKKLHICPFCNKGFIRHDSMKEHTNIHTRKTLFICKVCNKTFLHNTSLTRHKRTHSPIKHHICSICGNTFKRKDVLNRHIKNVHR